MELPIVFIQKMKGAFGKEGEDFLNGLEERIESISEQWELKIEGHVDNLSYNYVAKAVDRNNKPVILKLGVAGFDFTNEINTVRAYGGKGCARLIREDADNGAMLIERLLPGKMLFEQHNEDEAVEHFAKVWKAIRRPIPEGWQFPSILHWSKGLDRYVEAQSSKGPIPVDMVKRAKAIFQDLMDASQNIELLHGDLHHENILYSDEYGWTGIDPKGVVGDPYFDLTSFLTNHLFECENPKSVLEYRITRLESLLDLNRERFLKASFAMAMLYACWGVEDQDAEGAMNTFKCAEWLEELMRSNVKE